MLDLSCDFGKNMHIFIDESQFNITSYIYGAIAISDSNIELYKNRIQMCREKLQRDPAYYQFYNIDNLNKSFHYTQDHREVKNRFIELLKGFTFEIYLHIFYNVEINRKILSRIDYINILNNFLTKRFSENIIYQWEKDESLGKIDWPEKINISEASKQQEELLSISDYSIGIFRKIYLKEWDHSCKNSAIRDYESIANKIRFIKDANIRIPYTRRHPYIVDST